jgi:hypothetical protein
VGGRQIPEKCRHGVYVVGGDFLDDEKCPKCDSLFEQDAREWAREMWHLKPEPRRTIVTEMAYLWLKRNRSARACAHAAEEKAWESAAAFEQDELWFFGDLVRLRRIWHVVRDA